MDRLPVGRGRLLPRPPLGGLDLRLVGQLLHIPLPLRVVRTRPAVLCVECIPERIVEFLPPGGRDVVRAPVLEFAMRRQHVHMHASVLLAVQHRRPRVLVLVQPRPGGLLELVQRPLDLLAAGVVFGRPRDHARLVLVLEVERVRDRRHLVRVSPQHLDRLPGRPEVIALAEQVLRGLGCAARAVVQELNHHRGHSPAPPRAALLARHAKPPSLQGPTRSPPSPRAC